MRYILLLCTFLSTASELCKISSMTSFNNQKRSDLAVFLTNEHNLTYNTKVGTLFSDLLVKQLDFVAPNSSIYHTFTIQSSKTPEVYALKQHIHLKGCNIEFIEVESDDVEAEYNFNHNSMYISYNLVNKSKKEPQEENSFKLIE